jgi:hypothetical protein
MVIGEAVLPIQVPSEALALKREHLGPGNRTAWHVGDYFV